MLRWCVISSFHVAPSKCSQHDLESWETWLQLSALWVCRSALWYRLWLFTGLPVLLPRCSLHVSLFTLSTCIQMASQASSTGKGHEVSHCSVRLQHRHVETEGRVLRGPPQHPWVQILASPQEKTCNIRQKSWGRRVTEQCKGRGSPLWTDKLRQSHDLTVCD